VSALAWFAEHAARLAEYGYEPIPISRPTDRGEGAGKRPAMPEGWQRGCPREDWPRYATCGVGILTRNTPALDVDVLLPELAGAIQDVADRMLGDAPYRIGQAPKRLLPYRLAGEPFPKLKLEWKRGLGADLYPPGKLPGVEVLSEGQQFVSLGVHPATRKPYEWHRDPALSLPHGLLPGRGHADFARFLRHLAGVLRRLGAEEIKLKGPGLEPEAAGVAPRARARVAADAERIRDALERLGNADLHYDDWIRIGHALKAELPGGDGLAIWEWWSSLSPKNSPRVTRQKWATFAPRSVSTGTIYWEARR
jgi:hypothetical protein